MKQVIVRVSKAKLHWFLSRKLPRILSGADDDPTGLRDSCLARVVAAALEDVREDFLRKSQGQTGADGVTWEPLSEFTLRQRSETKKGTQGQGRSAKVRDAEAFGDLKKSRQEIYRQEYQRLRQGGLSAKEARRQATITAKFLARGVWQAQASVWSKGLPGRPGETPESLPILVDSETLLKSASPGTLSGSGLSTRYKPADNQRVEYERGGFSVYSDVEYGDAHMSDGQGSITGGFRPARPWKYPEVPAEWLSKWASVYAEALADGVAEIASNLDRWF